MLEDNWRALEKMKSFEKPFLCLYSDKDIVAPNGHKSVHPFIPGAQAYDPIILEGGSHFLLEDIPELYGETVLAQRSCANRPTPHSQDDGKGSGRTDLHGQSTQVQG